MKITLESIAEYSVYDKSTFIMAWYRQATAFIGANVHPVQCRHKASLGQSYSEKS